MHRQHQHQHYQHLHAHMNARMLERTHARSFLHCTALHYPLPRWHVLTPMDANTHTHTRTHIRTHARARLLPRTHTHMLCTASLPPYHAQCLTFPLTLMKICTAAFAEQMHCVTQYCTAILLRVRTAAAATAACLPASVCVPRLTNGEADGRTLGRTHASICIFVSSVEALPPCCRVHTISYLHLHLYLQKHVCTGKLVLRGSALQIVTHSSPHCRTITHR